MTSSEVQVIQEQFVNCKTPSILSDITDPWLLGPFDYNVPPIIPTAIIFLYKHPNSDSQDTHRSSFIPVNTLRESTEALLDYYPHLTGRLTINEEDRTPQVEHLGTGSLFTVAECSHSLESYRKDSSQRLLRCRQCIDPAHLLFY